MRRSVPSPPVPPFDASPLTSPSRAPAVKHLRNPWNQNREVKVSRDGTEIEPDVGRQLLNIWNAPSSPADLLPASVPAPGAAQPAPTSPTVAFSYASLSQSKALAAAPDLLGLGLSTTVQSSTA